MLREWRVDPDTFELDLAALERLLGPRTRLVCVTHCSNVLGTIMPIAEIARLVHAAGAELCVDGVAYAPHRRVDVQALGCDWYVYSFYKTYGPHQAVLWGRHERLLELDSLNHWFIGKDRVPYKLQPGNVNYELAWGCAGIPDYLDALGAAPRAPTRSTSSPRRRRRWPSGCWPGCAPATTCASSAAAARPRRARADGQLRRRRAGAPAPSWLPSTATASASASATSTPAA